MSGATFGPRLTSAPPNLPLCPQPAWRHADGSWQPAYANFTSLATPNELGSGKTALVTLLHEGGHGESPQCS